MSWKNLQFDVVGKNIEIKLDLTFRQIRVDYTVAWLW